MSSRRGAPQTRNRRTRRNLRSTSSNPPLPSTLNRYGLPLPIELHYQIADGLATNDLASYVRVCVLMHDVASQILYHTIDVTHDTAAQVFSALLLRFRPGSARHRRHPPAMSVRALTYTSGSSDDDLFILPVLCDLLLHTHALQHLCIEIPDDSSPVLLTLLKRRGLLRRPVTPVSAAFYSAEGTSKRLATPLTLPRLSSFQTSCSRVLGEFCQNRRLKAVGLSEVVGRLEMIAVLEEVSGMDVNPHLTAFTCFYDVLDSPKGQLWATGTCFPNLTYLGLEIPTHYALFSEQTYTVLTGLMLNLTSATHAFDVLETLSVEFPWALRALEPPFDRIDDERIQPIFNVFASGRPRFRRVLLGPLRVLLHERDNRWRVEMSTDNGDQRLFATASSIARIPLC